MRREKSGWYNYCVAETFLGKFEGKKRNEKERGFYEWMRKIKK